MVKTVFSEQTCIIEDAGDVIINVGGIDIKGKPYGAVKKKLCAKQPLKKL
jgi:hypothetical protein